MSYNHLMSEKKNKKTYSKEEISNMSYWQTWEFRRENGILSYTLNMALYVFMIYCFIKIMLILAYGDSLKFKVDLWIIPIVFLAGPIYYEFHEWYYHKVFLKKEEKGVR